MDGCGNGRMDRSIFRPPAEACIRSNAVVLSFATDRPTKTNERPRHERPNTKTTAWASFMLSSVICCIESSSSPPPLPSSTKRSSPDKTSCGRIVSASDSPTFPASAWMKRSSSKKASSGSPSPGSFPSLAEVFVVALFVVVVVALAAPHLSSSVSSSLGMQNRGTWDRIRCPPCPLVASSRSLFVVCFSLSKKSTVCMRGAIIFRS
mmetsp:Transcript_16420/g.33749  ORF Transcript_16420/g.33749 Transcript_16420/m.33749 type:complete len:207 (-) Transcript_16420:1010-1630(-)